MAMCLSKNVIGAESSNSMETSSKASTNGGSQTPTSVGAVNTSEFTPRSSPAPPGGGLLPPASSNRQSPPALPAPPTTSAAAVAAAAAAAAASNPLLGMLPSALGNPLAAAAGLSPSPPTLVPSAMSMVSMASMLGHPGAPHFLHPGYTGAAGVPGARDAFARDDFAASMSKFMDRSFGGGDSPPPPTVPTNDPTANECKIVEYRGEKVAAFVIQGKTMLCLPQVFELFLKHLVGGLHTVYTKLKRLEITPIVCNVEQVRILRGLGAIQPGVNRCKLLADVDFDALYKDCTTTRPGRPPKRGVPFPPMSPQDAMLHLKNSMQHAGVAAAAAANGTSPGSNQAISGAGGPGPIGSSPGSGGSNPTSSSTPSSDPYKDIPYAKEPRLDKSPFGNGFGPGPGGAPGLNPMAAQFMALNHPAHAAFLSQTGAMGAAGAAAGLIPGLPGANSSPGSQQQQAAAAAAAAAAQFMKGPGLTSLEALQRSGLLGAAYFERMREGQTKPGLNSSGEDLDSGDLHRRKRSTSQDSSHKDGRRSESPVLNLSKPSYSDSLSEGVRRDAGVIGRGDPGTGRREDVVSDDEFADDRALRRSVRSSSGAAQLTEGGQLSTASNKDSSQEQQQQQRAPDARDKVNNNTTHVLDDKSSSVPPPPPQSFPPQNVADLAAAAAAASNPTTAGPKDASQLSNVYGLIGNIQALLKAAVENTTKEKGKSEGDVIQGDHAGTKEMSSELDELKRNTQVYLRRIKKEKRHRKRLQEQLERETRKRVQMEEALRVTSAETLKRITETFAKETQEDALSTNSGGAEAAEQDVKRRRLDVVDDDDDEVTDDSLTSRSDGRRRRSHRRRRRSDVDGVKGDNLDKSDEDEDELLDGSSPGTGGTERSVSSPSGPRSSSSSHEQKQYNATVSATSTDQSKAGSGSTARDTPATLGIAKNLFPFNGSSLFTSAN